MPTDLSNIKRTPESITCSFCSKKSKPIFSDGELLCAKCGLVLENNLDWTSSYIGQNNTSVDHSVYDSAPTIVQYKDSAGKNVNLNLANSLKRTMQRTRVNTTYDRTKLKGLLEIDRLTHLLDLPAQIESIVIKVFLDFNKKGYFRNKNTYSCIAALIVIIANKHNIPLALVEILKLVVVPKRKFNQDYFYLYHLFETAGPTSASVDMHLKKYLSYVKPWNGYTEFKIALDLCIEQTNLYAKIGRSAIVNSGTLIYMLLKYYEYPNTEDLLKQLVINRLTLKNCWKTLLLNYPSLVPYNIEQGDPTLDIIEEMPISDTSEDLE